MKFNESIMNSRILSPVIWKKIVASADLPLTSDKYGRWIGVIRRGF
ncbi:hypothetical protein RCO48_37660 [Peribacillus frigoritolerans]|nr:hypothetical protein [Peribacillus frigoritolerans]